MDALAEAPLPSGETIARFRRELDDGQTRLARLNDERERTIGALAERRMELTELAAGPPVASPRAIAEARTARDGKWRVLRATLFNTDAALSGSAMIDGVGAFERYSVEADRLADRAAEDAERSVRQSVAERDCERLESRKTALEGKIEAVRAQHGEMLDAWCEAWAAAGIAPSTPEEMAAWLPAATALLVRREQNESRRHDLARMIMAEARMRPELERLADEIGLDHRPETASMTLIGQIEQRLRSLASGWATIRDLEARIGDARIRVERDETAARIAEASHAAWSEAWASSVSSIGLPADVGIEVAEAVLEKWAQVPAILAERDNRAARIAGMGRDIADFEERASRIIEAAAPDLADVPADAAIKTLHTRVTTAQAAKSRREELARRLSEAETALAGARAAADETSRTLATFGAKLPEIDPADALSRLRQRKQVEARLVERRQQLLLQADGMTEESLRDDLLAFDPDHATAAIQQLEEEKERLHREGQEIFAARDREMRRRDEIENGVGAEGAAFDLESANADIAASAREWAVPKIGSLLVGHVIEQHRVSQRDPLMIRAGDLFAGLTGGTLAGISQAFDDADAPRLIGQRSSGEPLRIEEMSEGTRDQLYLALRLAYLEDYAGRAGAAPFVGDDLFTTFDDARTAHGLKALAAIGNSIQPILFTHHRHVVEIAHAELGPDADVLELG